MASTTRRLAALACSLTLLLTLGLLLSACGKQLLVAPVRDQAGAWTMEVYEITDGPNAFRQGYVTYTPGGGNRFLWVYLRLTNQTDQDRRFSWSSCDLDDESGAILPTLVNLDSALNNLKQQDEIVRAREVLGRKLAFAFPKERLPTRLRCKNLEIPLDL